MGKIMVHATQGNGGNDHIDTEVVENLFDRTYHEHFSYQRDPFRSGRVINEPGRRVALTMGWRM